MIQMATLREEILNQMRAAELDKEYLLNTLLDMLDEIEECKTEIKKLKDHMVTKQPIPLQEVITKIYNPTVS